MAKGTLVGQFEQWVLMATLRLRGNAYGMTIRRDIESRAKRPITLSAVYTTLERAEEKGYLKAKLVNGGPERTGQPKKVYELTALGERSLAEALNAHNRMKAGLPRLGAEATA